MQALHLPAYYDDDLIENEAALTESLAAELIASDVVADQSQAEAAHIEPLIVDLEKEDDPADTYDPVDSLAPGATELGKRLGMHYFEDSDHYSQADLDLWLPVLKKLGVNWTVLQAPVDRAIPQEFIEVLVASQIQPIIHLNISLVTESSVDEFAPMFRAYASWGVRHVILFDRPNLRAVWPGQAWTQRDLVDRFLARFVPLAHAALEAGMIPVFPALEPGGDYWDTAFLRSALETMTANGEGLLLETMALGAYAWTEDKPMTWGAGGPENWPATMPYYTPEGSQDQRGFRIFDWYNAISRTVLGRELPVVIVGAGVQRESAKKLDAKVGTRAIKIIETLARPADPNKNNAVPANVLACNLWLLSAEEESQAAHSAWFELNSKPTKIGREWIDWQKGEVETKSTPPVGHRAVDSASPQNSALADSHYLLLPSTMDYPMEAIRAFLHENSSAIVGASPAEAANAARVTLAGGMQAFPDDVVKNLIQAGCTIHALRLEAA
ncbi:MAG: hypothetical protein WD740_06610 [Anaerolineales bacterium]